MFTRLRFLNSPKQLNKSVIKISQWASLMHAFLADMRSKQSAWELSGKFEGDIVLPEDQVRNGLISPATRWPNRTVPYVIDDVFSEYPADIYLCPRITTKRYMWDVEVNVQHDKKCMQKEMKSKLVSGKACYHSVQNSSRIW
jgi:hypothetical protein